MSPTRQTFDCIAGLMKQRSAIQLPAGKGYLVESRLIPLARQAGSDGTTTVDKWIQAVITTRRPGDLQDIAEALATNETSFFYDVIPFRGLAESVIPQLQQNGRPNISIWSVACSTDQGPYSIVMSILDLSNPPQFSIVATDLSRTVPTKVKRGFYTQPEVNQGLSAPMLVRYFQREGANWTINPKLWQEISFIEHNLMSTPPKGGPFRIAFIHNVLTYFGLDAKKTVLRRVANTTAPGGYSFLGATETTMGISPVQERITLTKDVVYRLKGGTR